MTSTSTAKRVARRSSNSGGRRSSVQPQATTALLPRRRALFEAILVPTDFSAESIEVLGQAMELAEQSSGSVHLLHVVDKRQLAPLERLALLPDDPSLMAKAKNKLVQCARDSGHPAVPVYPLTRLGEPWREIAGAAAELKASVIMLPTHGYKGLQRVMLGSVAERVVRSAPCPVLVVRPESSDETQTERRSL